MDRVDVSVMADHTMSQSGTRPSRSKKLPAIIVVCACALALAMRVAASGNANGRTPTAGTLNGTGPSTDLPALASIDNADSSPFLERDEGQPVRAAFAEPELVEQQRPLIQAEEDLVAYTTLSLDGAMFVDDVLDCMLEFASLPVASHPDLDFEDDDALAYRLEGTAEGTEARILIGREPYYEDGKVFRYLQLDVELGANTFEFVRGATRYNPNIDLSISYDVEHPDTPTRFALLVQRDVALGKSLDAGIDAYHGRFTTGAYFWVDLLKDPNNPTTGTVGRIDGQHASISKFDGVRPLAGDTELAPERLAAVLDQLHAHLATIKGE